MRMLAVITDEYPALQKFLSNSLTILIVNTAIIVSFL